MCPRPEWSTAHRTSESHALAFPDVLRPVALPDAGQIHLALSLFPRVGYGYKELPQGLHMPSVLSPIYTSSHAHMYMC